MPPTWGSPIANVVVARDDKWGTDNFQDLVDPTDLHFGLRVATGFNTNFNGTLGPDRFGSDLALAIDPRPKHCRRVWVAWCDMIHSFQTSQSRLNSPGPVACRSSG